MALIDRDALIESLTEHGKTAVVTASSRGGKTFALIVGHVARKIEEQPIVDAKPVVRGEWIWDDKLGRWYCSNCDNSPDFGFDFDNPGWMPDMNYCPNCGADMRGSANASAD